MTTHANTRLQFKKNLARDPRTGRWHVRLRIHGRRAQKGGFPSKQSASLFLEHQILNAAGVPLEGPAPTLKEAANSYLERLRLLQRSEDTIRYYEPKVLVLTQAFGDPPLDRISQANIEGFVKERSREVKPSTVNKELSFLRSLYRHTEIDPSWALAPLSAQTSRRFVHSRDVVRELWSTLAAETKVAVGLCLFVGLRQKTAYEADATWVHGSELWIPHSKTGESFKTYVVPTLSALLPSEGKLVRKNRDAIRSELMRRSKKLKINPPYQGIGGFRHHCATYLAECGVSPDVIRLVLTHSVGGVTARYVASQSLTLKRDALTKVEEYLFRN